MQWYILHVLGKGYKGLQHGFYKVVPRLLAALKHGVLGCF